MGGVPAGIFEEGKRLELYTGSVTVVVFAQDEDHALAPARALRRLGGIYETLGPRSHAVRTVARQAATPLRLTVYPTCPLAGATSSAGHGTPTGSRCFRTLLNLIERLADQGVPNRIDRSFLNYLSGITQTYVIAALKTFELTE